MAHLQIDERDLTVEEILKLLFCGLVFFPGLFLLCMYIGLKTSCGQSFQKKYKLRTSEILDICNKAVSSVQALTASSVGIFTIANCRHDLINAKTIAIEMYAWFGFSYFYYDTISMYYVYKCEKAEKRNAEPRNAGNECSLNKFFYDKALILIHHVILTPIGFAIVVHFRKGLGDCLVGFLYIMECSTPFVSLRSMLSKMKMKSSLLYVVNGLVMIFAFFSFRLLIFFYIAVEYGRQQGMSLFEVMTGLPIYVYIILFLLIFPQVYWFVLMVNGALKIMGPKSWIKTKAA